MVTDTFMAGFSPNRVATGVLDPLTARILYLEDAGGPLVWIATDLIGLMQPDIDDLRARLKDIAPSRLFAAATHTHSGPDTMGLWGPSYGDYPYRSGRDPEYMKWMLDQIAVGVKRAQARKRPALLGFGEDTRDKSEWVVNIRQPGYNDPALTVLRVDGVDGRPIACLVNFACHPETLWEKNTELSPDFVHHLNKVVEDETGATALYFSGALGGMVTMTLDDDTALDERRVHYKKLGKALGKIAVETWRQIKTAAHGEIVHRQCRQGFPFDNQLLFFLANLGIFVRDLKDGRIETTLDFWQIGPAQFATLPGEALPAIGFAAKRLMTGKPNFLFCLGNDELGYILNAEQAADEKYKYERSVSVGPEAAAMFLQVLGELVRGK
jgi:hypothetical protein